MSISDPTKCVDSILNKSVNKLKYIDGHSSINSSKLDGFLFPQFNATGTDSRKSVGLYKDIHDRIARTNLLKLNGKSQPHVFLSPLYDESQRDLYESQMHHSSSAVALPASVKGIPLPKGLSRSSTERVLKLSAPLLHVESSTIKDSRVATQSITQLLSKELQAFNGSPSKNQNKKTSLSSCSKNKLLNGELYSGSVHGEGFDNDLLDEDSPTNNFNKSEHDKSGVNSEHSRRNNEQTEYIQNIMHAASRLFQRDDRFPSSINRRNSMNSDNLNDNNGNDAVVSISTNGKTWSETRLGVNDTLKSTYNRSIENSLSLRPGKDDFSCVLNKPGDNIDTSTYMRTFVRVGNSRPSPCFTSVSRQVPAAYAPLGTDDLQINLADGVGEADPRAYSYKIKVKEGEGEEGMATKDQANHMQVYEAAIHKTDLSHPLNRRHELTQMKEALEETEHLMNMQRLEGKRNKVLQTHYKKGIPGIDGPHLPATKLYAQQREELLASEQVQSQTRLYRQSEQVREGILREGQIKQTQVRTECDMNPFAGRSIRGSYASLDATGNEAIAQNKVVIGSVAESLVHDGNKTLPSSLRRCDSLCTRNQGWTSLNVDPSTGFRFLDTKDRLFPKSGYSWNKDRAVGIWERDRGSMNGENQRLPTGIPRSYDIIKHQNADCPQLNPLPPNNDFCFDPFQPSLNPSLTKREALPKVNTSKSQKMNSIDPKNSETNFLSPREPANSMLVASRSAPVFGVRVGSSPGLNGDMGKYFNNGRVRLHEGMCGGYLPVNTALESLRASGQT